MEKLKTMGCSREAVCGVREVGNVTLLAVNDFMIPIIRDGCGGRSIAENLLKSWDINPKDFFYTALNVVKGADPLPKHCYDASVSSCGLAFEWTLVAPGLTLDPAIVKDSTSPRFERMDSRTTFVMVDVSTPGKGTSTRRATDLNNILRE